MSFTHQDWDPVVLNKNTKPKPSDGHQAVKSHMNKPSNGIKVEKVYYDKDEEPENKPVMIDKEFGMLVQKFRTAKGLTQKELAQAINLPVQVINEYERGTGVRNSNYVSKIKNYLGITKNNS